MEPLLSLTPLEAFVAALTVFVLAIFIGIEVITKVPPTLHTPLMSGSNAISGITIVGALIAAGSSAVAGGPRLVGVFTLAEVLGFLAVIFAMVNVVGGFLVTHRMLQMFRRKD
jgi:NAD(P) transhydrogenase subunit alpha